MTRLTPPIVCVCLAAFVVGAAAASDPWVDASGLDRFWAIYDTLVRDESPTDAQWDAMFAAPGYLQLDRVERRSDWMKPIYEMAFRPSRT